MNNKAVILSLEYPPEHIVDADDTMRPGRPAVMNDGSVTLHPHPTSIFGQKPVVLGGHLTFVEHYNKH